MNMVLSCPACSVFPCRAGHEKLVPGSWIDQPAASLSVLPETMLALLASAPRPLSLCSYQVVSSAIVDKYIGESARVIREMFGYARDHQPCVIFMDEIDAIGGRRFSEGTSADREIQRTLMELLSQLDGFDVVGKVRQGPPKHGWRVLCLLGVV